MRDPLKEQPTGTKAEVATPTVQAGKPLTPGSEAQLVAGNPAMQLIRDSKSLFAFVYGQYGFPSGLRGSDSKDSLGILETVMYRETFGSGTFPKIEDQHRKNAMKDAHNIVGSLNAITRAMGVDLYSLVDKSSGPSLTKYNIKPRETMRLGVISAIEDPTLRSQLLKAYDNKLGYVPEHEFQRIVVGNPLREMQILGAIMKAYQPLVDQVKALKAERNQPFTRKDEVAAYYEAFYRGPEGFATIYLQKDLVAAGFLPPSGVDGGIGDTTRAALESFRRNRGKEIKPPVVVPENLRR